MGKYFGTDGFRGVAGGSLTSLHAFWVGRFLGFYLKKQDAQTPVRILIGKDTRHSGDMLESALVSGLTTSGANAYLAGVTTTPAVAYLARTEKFDAAVMISASHNGYQDNGLKLIDSHGEKMQDEFVELLEEFLDNSELQQALPQMTGESIGRVVDFQAGTDNYINFLLSCVPLSLDGLRVGLDCANGSTWQIAPAVFQRFGAKVEVISALPDGKNINRDCGSTHIESLKQLVKENGLDLGFAFDGDGDRVIAMDEAGEEVDGDKMLFLCALWLKKHNKLPKNAVVATVMSNLGLRLGLAKHGIELVSTAVGDRFVYQAMKEGGHSLGGEQSGHIIFGDLATTGDGILTSLMVLSSMLGQKQSLHQLCTGMQHLPQVIKNVKVKDRQISLALPELKEEVEQANKQLVGKGRVLVRASGTEPVIRIMVESASTNECEEIALKLARILSENESR